MLTEDEQRHQFDPTMAALAALELAMLGVIAHELLSHPDDPEAGAFGLAAGLAKALSDHRSSVMDNAHNDMAWGFHRNAERDIQDSHAEGAVADWARTEAGRIAAEAEEYTQLTLDQLLERMREAARQSYYETAREAARQAPRCGYPEAMKRAISALAREGITEYTYTRADGTVVHVPVDVAVRRELVRSGKSRQDKQQLDLAKRTGVNLVDVSFCGDARESHAVWQGKRYQLNGSGKYPNFYDACHVGDMVEGFGGYNCHHTLKLRFSDDDPFYFDDPLEGTGYTNEEVRKLTTKQRRLENHIRKAKREVQTLEKLGLDASDAKAEVRYYQKKIRDLVSEHKSVLSRDSKRWREQIYSPRVVSMQQNEPLVKLGKVKNGLSVSPVVNTKAYHDAFERLPLRKPVSESLYKQTGRILQETNGTSYEHLAAVDAKTGALLADNIGIKPTQERRTGFTKEVADKLKENPNGIVLIHNHPNSFQPSLQDVRMAAAEESVKGSVIAGHDGSLWFVSASEPGLVDVLDGMYNQLINQGYTKGRAKTAVLEAVVDAGTKHTGLKWERIR